MDPDKNVAKEVFQVQNEIPIKINSLSLSLSFFVKHFEKIFT